MRNFKFDFTINIPTLMVIASVIYQAAITWKDVDTLKIGQAELTQQLQDWNEKNVAQHITLMENAARVTAVIQSHLDNSRARNN